MIFKPTKDGCSFIRQQTTKTSGDQRQNPRQTEAPTPFMTRIFAYMNIWLKIKAKERRKRGLSSRDRRSPLHSITTQKRTGLWHSKNIPWTTRLSLIYCPASVVAKLLKQQVTHTTLLRDHQELKWTTLYGTEDVILKWTIWFRIYTLRWSIFQRRAHCTRLHIRNHCNTIGGAYQQHHLPSFHPVNYLIESSLWRLM